MKSFDKIAQCVNAAACDGSNWNTLYRKFYPGMYAIALGICKDKETAADAVQDAFITAYTKISQLKEPEKFAGWIKQIVVRTCYRPKAKTKINLSLEQIGGDSKHVLDDLINRTLDESDKRNKFYCALSSLPEVLSSTVLLRYFSVRQSYEEIAAILDIPVGTVRSRLNQAKTKLRDFWSGMMTWMTRYSMKAKNGTHFTWTQHIHSVIKRTHRAT